MIAATVTFRTSGGHMGRVELGYDPAEPFQVTATFFQGLVPVVWPFARDLLVQGLREPAGLGDVAVSRSGGRVYLRLSPPDGTETFELPARSVRQFLARTRKLVQVGAERVDIADSALEAWLAGDPR